MNFFFTLKSWMEKVRDTFFSYLFLSIVFQHRLLGLDISCNMYKLVTSVCTHVSSPEE